MSRARKTDGSGSRDGARATGDKRRDLWRTPDEVCELVVHAFGATVDLAARGTLAHGFYCGVSDFFFARVDGLGPDDVGYCNPPFSQIGRWAQRLKAYEAPVIVACKLAPSTRWWADLVSPRPPDAPLVGLGLRHYGLLRRVPGRKGRKPQAFPYSITLTSLGNGVVLGLFDRRIAYVPPSGIAESSPRFESALIFRGFGLIS